MTFKFLILNADKTDVLIIHPNNPSAMYYDISFYSDGILLNPSKSVCNLGALFD